MTTGKPIDTASGRANITTTQAGSTRHRIYGWGDHADVINPGDLMVETVITGDGFRTTATVHYRGRDVHRLAAAATEAAALYDENADWLGAPATRIAGGAA